VREVVGVTAYTVGDFALALRELLTHRRISGSNDQLPLIVDSERGLGRPERALEVGRSVDRNTLSAGVRVNLAIAMSGARLDKGENDLALAELQIPELNPERVFNYSPALFRAYADTLDVLGRDAESKRWFELADRADSALLGNPGPEDEVFQVLEEIEIPVLAERKVWEPRVGEEDRPRREGFAPRRESSDSRRDGAAPRRDGSAPRREGSAPRREGFTPRRDDERQARSFNSDSDRPARSTSRDSERQPRNFGKRPGGFRDR
jgi:hypothetical protein